MVDGFGGWGLTDYGWCVHVCMEGFLGVFVGGLWGVL